MINLKNLIVFLLTLLFIYIVYEFFYNNIPKMIEPFDLNSIPPTLDINLNMATGGLEQLNSEITKLKQKQKMSQASIDVLKRQLSGTL